MVIYLLLVNIAILLSYSLYQLSFKALTFFQWNRWYLLITLVLALLIPIGLFIDLSAYTYTYQELPVVDLAQVIEIPITLPRQVAWTYTLTDVLVFVYSIGVLITIGKLVFKLWYVKRMFESEADYMGFSFFNKMFLGYKVKNYAAIEKHERVHMEQGHSYDLVFVELMKIMHWFNPVIYWLSKELKFQHECIADELCSEDKVAYAELLVAHAMKVDRQVLVHEFSNQSFLKKRIMMLFKNKSSKNKRFLYLGVIPAIMVVGLSTLVFNTSRAKNIVSDVASVIEDVKMPVIKGTGQTTPYIGADLSLMDAIREELIQQDTSKKIIQTTPGNEIFEAVEISPEPPGGMAAFRRWIGENFEFPQEAIDAGIKGTIQISYIVEKDGTLSEQKVVKDLGYGTGDAALSLIKKAPKWSPGIQNGRPVRVAYTLPIRLDLTKLDEPSTEKSLPAATPELGYKRLRAWLNEAYKLPRDISASDSDPYVYVSFEVNPDGTFGKSFIGKSPLGGAFTAELIKHIKNSKWEPADINGEKQISRGYLYIKFNKAGKIIEDYDRVEVTAEPNGGLVAFRKFIQDNFTWPNWMSDNKSSGKVVLNFDIDKQGRPGNYQVVNSSHSDLEKSLIKVIEKQGNWLPAIVDGEKLAYKTGIAVDVIYGQPTFDIKVSKLTHGEFVR